MLLKKGCKVKKSKYKIKIRDFQVTVIMNFLSGAVLQLKNDIQNSSDPVELYSSINEKYALMDLALQFGFSEYAEELKIRKSTEKEVNALLEQRKTDNEIVVAPSSTSVVEKKQAASKAEVF